MRAGDMRDPATKVIVAFNVIARQPSEPAMCVQASGFVHGMTDQELRLAHEAGSTLGRIAGLALAQRRRV